MALVTIEVPSLEEGFGVELTLLIPFTGVWGNLYTYYNHGLESPHGGVISAETGADVEFEAGQFDNVLRYIDKWITYVSCIAEIPTKHNPDLPLEYKLEIDGNGLGDVIMNIVMETLNAGFIWVKDSGLIIFKARDAFDLSWEGFLFYVKCLEDFSSKIKEQ